MTRNRKTLALLPLAAALQLLPAGAAVAESIVEAWRDALASDPVYTSARASRAASAERSTQGRAGLLPNVTLTANAVRNDIEVNGISDSSTSRAYELRLTQPLWRAQNWIAYDQAKLTAAQADAEFRQAEQDLILRVAQAYFDVLVAEENLRVVESQKLAIGQQLELAKKSYEVGTATITDVHEAQSRFDLSTAQGIAAENDLAVRQRALAVVTGKEYAAFVPLREPVTLASPEPMDMTSWSAAAERDNPAVVAQQAQTEIASLEADRARAGHQPTLDLIATAGQSDRGRSQFTGTLSDTESRTIGVYLTVPLYQGGGTQSAANEAAYRRDAAVAGLDAARRNAAQGARQAYLGVVSGLAQIRALEAAVVSSEAALASNRLGYEVGVRINIDVLNAEQQLSAARRDLVKARYDTLLAQMQLKAAVGALDEAVLQQTAALMSR
ncbi:MAG TPA: TolC family outer membrane protein [Rhodocyclaceae bacterium]